jgi:hypothetical protein
MTLIRLNGDIVATASSLRVHLTRALPTPQERFVHAMGMYARDVLTGELPGPYSDQEAEAYARGFLIDDATFRAHAGDTDEQLADRFTVPLEQIALKRLDHVAT